MESTPSRENDPRKAGKCKNDSSSNSSLDSDATQSSCGERKYTCQKKRRKEIPPEFLPLIRSIQKNANSVSKQKSRKTLQERLQQKYPTISNPCNTICLCKSYSEPKCSANVIRWVPPQPEQKPKLKKIKKKSLRKKPVLPECDCDECMPVGIKCEFEKQKKTPVVECVCDECISDEIQYENNDNFCNPKSPIPHCQCFPRKYRSEISCSSETLSRDVIKASCNKCENTPVDITNESPMMKAYQCTKVKTGSEYDTFECVSIDFIDDSISHCQNEEQHCSITQEKKKNEQSNIGKENKKEEEKVPFNTAEKNNTEKTKIVKDMERKKVDSQKNSKGDTNNDLSSRKLSSFKNRCACLISTKKHKHKTEKEVQCYFETKESKTIILPQNSQCCFEKKVSNPKSLRNEECCCSRDVENT